MREDWHLSHGTQRPQSQIDPADSAAGIQAAFEATKALGGVALAHRVHTNITYLFLSGFPFSFLSFVCTASCRPRDCAASQSILLCSMRHPIISGVSHTKDESRMRRRQGRRRRREERRGWATLTKIVRRDSSDAAAAGSDPLLSMCSFVEMRLTDTMRSACLLLLSLSLVCVSGVSARDGASYPPVFPTWPFVIHTWPWPQAADAACQYRSHTHTHHTRIRNTRTHSRHTPMHCVCVSFHPDGELSNPSSSTPALDAIVAGCQTCEEDQCGGTVGQ